MTTVFTVNITALDHHATPEKTMEVLETASYVLEDETFNHTLDETKF